MVKFRKRQGMEEHELVSLRLNISKFEKSKDLISSQWINYSEPKYILHFHKIDTVLFKEHYASGVFDYFMAVIRHTKNLFSSVMHLVWMPSNVYSRQKLMMAVPIGTAPKILSSFPNVTDVLFFV